MRNAPIPNDFRPVPCDSLKRYRCQPLRKQGHLHFSVQRSTLLADFVDSLIQKEESMSNRSRRNRRFGSQNQNGALPHRPNSLPLWWQSYQAKNATRKISRRELRRQRTQLKGKTARTVDRQHGVRR